MLQNINILAGKLPAETGDVKKDIRELRAYTLRLIRALELCLDTLDAEQEKLRQIVTTLEGGNT